MAQVRARKPRIERVEQDLFISGVDRIEVIGGGMVRVLFFINQEGEGVNLECAPAPFAIVMPVSAMPDAIGKSLATTSRAVFAHGGSTLKLMQ